MGLQNGNISNVRIGVCNINYNSVNLGHTKDGVVLKFDRKFQDVTVDEYGDIPIDSVLTGQDLTVEVTLAEPTIANLLASIPEAGRDSGAQGSRLNLGRSAGWSARTNASFQLVLHPISKAASDLSDDIVIYRAFSTEPIELPYKVDEQRVFKVTFRALVDETYADGRRLGHIGLTTVS